MDGLLQGQELEDFHDSQLYPVYLLLIGYAVENLIKGIIFSKDPSLIDSNGKLSKAHTNHNLVTLYKAAGLSPDQDTKDLLNGLGEYIVWRGRYAVTKERNKYVMQRDYPTLHDRAKINGLILHLTCELKKIPTQAFTATRDDL